MFIAKISEVTDIEAEVPLATEVALLENPISLLHDLGPNPFNLSQSFSTTTKLTNLYYSNIATPHPSHLPFILSFSTEN